jgi:hypothetical protein
MGYTSRSGRRPDEHASRAAHHHIINDPVVQAFCGDCVLPEPPDALDIAKHTSVTMPPPDPAAANPIRHIIAVDGGYTEVVLRKDYPSSTMAFFQFGALIFSVGDLESLAHAPFILPEQIAKLKNIQRFKLALPTRAIAIKGCATLTDAVRRTVYDFFVANSADDPLIKTLGWLVFEEYAATPADKWTLASCPVCNHRRIELARAAMAADHSFACPACGGRIVLTDVLRLHEAVDDELGAGGILGYVVTAIEQLIVAHLIRLVLKTKPALLREVLFVKDGPLAFFGQTANLHKPMRRLVNHLLATQNLYLVGSEKSGAFADHADAISALLPAGTALLLDDEYIHRYIIPGKADPDRPYGSTTYYGAKMIYKTPSGQLYVLTLPTPKHAARPTEADFPNLAVILANVGKLRCDMYDNALIPVALVNKLVSLSDHPSAAILEKFARQTVSAS